ncbi:Isochorismatase-like protein [Suillus clintonianus]|uniref:Isochorismatase-like protein n=1 Tax=Suillus clintonianus TaxID=1904413 RepID=UPI001B86EC09|nr:Isochorismatase-like protein [Suillus clintonianus]KAG2153330.1 Isochorismatase-like protein [Suillus clintonianus]
MPVDLAYVEPSNSAILVIDVQNDFVSGSLAVRDAEQIINTINALITLPFALKIGTQDYHPANHISFARNHAGKNEFEKIAIFPPAELVATKKPNDEKPLEALEQVLWPVHCVQDTPGVAFVDNLEHEGLEVVRKGCDVGIECYSAFEDPWGLTNTGLKDKLKNKEISNVFVVGIAGDYCVKFTALDAKKHGFRTFVVKDAVKSVSDEGTEWTEMNKAGVEIIDTAEELLTSKIFSQ